MPDKTVTLSDQDWQQLTAIIANATGYMAFQRLVQQLQAQDGAQLSQMSQAQPQADGNGLDRDPPDVSLRRVPRQ